MAIGPDFRPARMPQGQQWFQLPLDKMEKVLSNAQLTSDYNKGEVEALTSMTFANIKDDTEAATEARSWLASQADKLVEEYGSDARAWGAGLAKLKKEVAYRFDPNTGDIGAMQSRVDMVSAEQARIKKEYAKNPELMNYALSKISVDPLEASMGDKVNFGITPPRMVSNVPQKDINKFIDGTIANVLPDTYEKFGLQEYPTYDEFVKAFANGTVTGIPYKKLVEAISLQVPPEYLTSNYQMALARGADPAYAENELHLVLSDGSLNPNNTLALAIMGAAQGASYEKEDINYTTMQNVQAVENLKTKAKEAEKFQKAQSLSWVVPTKEYEYTVPWGNTTATISEYTKKTNANTDVLKDELLVAAGLSIKDAATISPDALVGAERSSDGQNTVWKFKDQNGNEKSIAASDGAMEQFKSTYSKAEIMKGIANESLAEAELYATEYLKKNYNLDLTIDVPKVDGMSSTEVLSAISGYEKYMAEKMEPGWNPLIAGQNVLASMATLAGVAAAVLTGESPDAAIEKGASMRAGLNVDSKYTKEIADFKKLVSYASLSGSAEELDKFYKDNRTAITKTGDIINNKLKENEVVRLQGVSTSDFGGTPEENDLIQKDLKEVFNSFEQVKEFKVYRPGVSQPITMQAATKEAVKASKLDVSKGYTIEQTGKIFRTMQPMPDGTFHWQVDYKITSNADKSSTSLKLLFPSDATSAISSSFYEALDNSPEAKAVENLLVAKNFNLTDYTIPGTGMKIKSSGQYVNLSQPDDPNYKSKPLTYNEAKDQLTKYYQIQEIQKAHPEMSIQEATNLYNYYSGDNPQPFIRTTAEQEGESNTSAKPNRNPGRAPIQN